MGIIENVKRTAGEALSTVRAGTQKLVSRRLSLAELQQLRVSSPAFSDGGALPVRSTADGENVSPPVHWGDVPNATRSVIVICEDPDAPLPEPFVHWIVYGIPKAVQILDADELSTLREGQNSGLKTGFTGADPPVGHGLHHYHFQVFALDVPIDLEPGEGRYAVLRAMEGHVLAWGETVGVYERK